jgi:ABC-2 type transport system permease protein
MTAWLALVQVQLRLYLNNRKALVLNLLVPILIATFFGSLFGGSGGSKEPVRVKVGWVDEDRSPASLAIGESMAADAQLQLERLTRDEAMQRVRAGKLPVAVVLPAQFGEQAGNALFMGAKPELPLFYDPSDRMALGLVRGLLTQHVMQQVLFKGFSGAQGTRRAEALQSSLMKDPAMPPERREQLGALLRSVNALQTPLPQEPAASAPQSGGMPMPFETREEAVTGSRAGYNGYAHSFAGMGVQFVLMLGVDLGVGLLLMRRSGLWLRLRAAPLSKGTVLGSYFVSIALIAFVIFALELAAGMLMFGFRVEGSGLGCLLILASYALFTAGFGLFLAAVGGSPEATRGLAIMATLLLVMLGGAWVPSFVFPAWMQEATLFVPVRWAVDGLDAMLWRGQDLTAALRPAGVLMGSALVLVMLAVWRFRWREGE